MFRRDRVCPTRRLRDRLNMDPRSTRVVVIAAWGASLAAGGGCSVFYSLEGLSGEGDAAAPNDAEAAVDVSMDVADASETEAGRDARGDDAAISEGGASGFCASFDVRPTLCADFDEDAPYSAGWSSVTLAGGGQMVLDLDASLSPPGSMLATIPAFDSGMVVQPQANLGSALLANATDVHLEAEVRLDAIGATDEAVALSIRQQASDGSYLQVSLFMVAGSGLPSFVQEQVDLPNGTSEAHEFTVSAVPLGMWVPYAFDLRPGTPPRIMLSVNGAPALDQPLQYNWQPSPYTVQVGIGYIGSTNGEYRSLQMHVDNVVAYLQ